MASSSRSTYGKLAIDISDSAVFGSFDSGSVQFEYVSENVRMQQVHGAGGGIRGTRSRGGSRTRILTETISGPITFEPTPVELSTLLHLALGGTPSGTSYTLAEALPQFGLLVDRVANRFVYADCKVNKLTVAGQQGQPIVVTLDVEGKTEAVTATAFPGTVPAIDTANSPYIMADMTFALAADASATEAKAFSLVVDNFLETDRFMNSVTRDCIDEQDRGISLAMQLPYNADTIDLHDQSVTAGTGGSLTLTNGASSTVFTFVKLLSPAQSPGTSRRGDEIMLDLALNAEDSGATKELVVTHTE